MLLYLNSARWIALVGLLSLALQVLLVDSQSPSPDPGTSNNPPAAANLNNDTPDAAAPNNRNNPATFFLDSFTNFNANQSACFSLTQSTFCRGLGDIQLPKNMSAILQTRVFSQVQTDIDFTKYNLITNTAQFDGMFRDVIVNQKSFFLSNFTTYCSYNGVAMRYYSLFMYKFLAWYDNTCEGRSSKVPPICNSDGEAFFSDLTNKSSTWISEK